ncbi:MAG: 50S ribosomal protein L9 [Alphaproteobacteria bacterium]
MEVILLERIERLGQMGDVVNVKNGYARNYLLPQKKALRKTKDNMAFFESKRKEYEAHNLKLKAEAEEMAEKIKGLSVVIIRQAAETGQLYGSVTVRDIAEAVHEAGFKIERRQIDLNQPFKNMGIFDVRVSLHPDVVQTIRVVIARTADEAKKTEAKAKAKQEKVVEVQETPAE